jgi:hypothetical protein
MDSQLNGYSITKAGGIMSGNFEYLNQIYNNNHEKYEPVKVLGAI